jgi:isopentenyl-diphosphate delta-isomerase
MSQSLILVDENDQPVDQGDVLLQKRAVSKYHSGGLWTNTCCGHPVDGEEIAAAAHRRLFEEMGFDCPMKEVFTFIYKVDLDHDLKEHEFDHVFVGVYSGEVFPNPEEADGFRWTSMSRVLEEIAQSPDNYTVWSRIAFLKLSIVSDLNCPSS